MVVRIEVLTDNGKTLSHDPNLDKVLAEAVKYADGIPPAVLITSALVLLLMTIKRVDSVTPIMRN